MKILRSVNALLRYRAQVQAPVGFVPTMGALHRGHEALFLRAHEKVQDDGVLIASLFVNPLQFGPTEDLASYPKTFAADCRLAEAAGVDALFCPDREGMYADDQSVQVEETKLSGVLCGASRPGHFRGVCTVVAKLFNLVRPNFAVFGEKDWQQLAILRRMVRDLNFPVRLIGHPIVRESDGLALSSRNAYLLPAERALAPHIYRSLRQGVALARRGKTPRQVERAVFLALSKNPELRVDYIQVVDAENLQPARDYRRPTRLAAAVYLGKARLIDNVGIPRIS